MVGEASQQSQKTTQRGIFRQCLNGLTFAVLCAFVIRIQLSGIPPPPDHVASSFNKAGWISKRTYNSTTAEQIFRDTAFSLTPITDKVKVHTYDIMYGIFLMPFYEVKPNMKLLEIGLGCDIGYGPGASVALWKKLFPEAELWGAEFNAECVEKSKAEGKLNGLNILTGDQMDIPTLDRWIEESGGANFDVVIDDGGHKNCQIWTTLMKLWPKLNPGGLYFIEDLFPSRDPKFNDVESELCPKSTNVVDELKKIADEVVHRRAGGLQMEGIKFVFCQEDACVLGKHSSGGFSEKSTRGQQIFYDAAMSFNPITDKVTTHPYDIMYGTFLLPFYEVNRNMKFLEIGLGCDMGYGPGASVAVWKKLIPEAELWEAEFNAECVEKSKAEGKLNGLNTLTGDQMDIPTLDRWIKESGGANFDVVIDDGGHKNCQIWTSLMKLWPKLNPGGLYFLEDLFPYRDDPRFNDVESKLCPKSTNVVDEMTKVVDAVVHRAAGGLQIKGVKFIFCQQDSCVLGKH